MWLDACIFYTHTVDNCSNKFFLIKVTSAVHVRTIVVYKTRFYTCHFIVIRKKKSFCSFVCGVYMCTTAELYISCI